jgi:hypothetical protein
MRYVVMVRCSTTDTAVQTGIRCRIEEFSALPPVDQFNCSACGEEHNWSTADAWLRDAIYATGELARRVETEEPAVS